MTSEHGMQQLTDFLKELEELGIQVRPVAPRRRGRIYAVGTHKGGLGKSTTVAHLGKNIAAALAKTHQVESATLRGQYESSGEGSFLARVAHLQQRRVRGQGENQSVSKRKVLLVDLDSQSNLKGFLNVPVRPGYTLMEVIKGQRKVTECIEKVPGSADHLYLLPAGKNLTELEPLLWGLAKDAKEWVIKKVRQAVKDGEPITETMLDDWETEAAVKEHASMQILRDVLDPLLDAFEMIILDLPPARSRVTLSGLSAADEVLIVSEANEISREAIAAFMETIREAKQYNEDLNTFGILITRFRGRNDEAEKLVEIRQEYGERVFKTVIYENPKIAQAFGKGITAAKQTTKRNYGEFTAEFLEREQDGLPDYFPPLAIREEAIA